MPSNSTHLNTRPLRHCSMLCRRAMHNGTTILPTYRNHVRSHIQASITYKRSYDNDNECSLTGSLIQVGILHVARLGYKAFSVDVHRSYATVLSNRTQRGSVHTQTTLWVSASHTLVCSSPALHCAPTHYVFFSFFSSVHMANCSSTQRSPLLSMDGWDGCYAVKYAYALLTLLPASQTRRTEQKKHEEEKCALRKCIMCKCALYMWIGLIAV